jgi:hypothetical protein
MTGAIPPIPIHLCGVCARNLTLGSIESAEFYNQLSNYQEQKKDFGLWTWMIFLQILIPKFVVLKGKSHKEWTEM